MTRYLFILMTDSPKHDNLGGYSVT